MATINGTSGDDTLNGTSGDDVIDGGGGNDTIYGGDGLDRIHGGAGDDVIHAGDTSNLLFPEFIWDDAGNDTVYGEGGQDVIYGSPGDDYYDGGTGGTQPFELDEVVYSDAAAGIVVDMRLTSGQVHSSGSGDAANVGVDTLANFEAIAGSAFDDVMTAGDAGGITFGGEAGNDVLTGGTGADGLQGGYGNDVLTGGEGADDLDGGDGNDLLDGGGGTDIAHYADSTSGVNVSLAITGPQDTGQGIDTLTNIESLEGSDFNDTLIGNDGSNYLYGRGGEDVIRGGAGNDSLEGAGLLDGGDGNDVIQIASASSDVIEFRPGDDQDRIYYIESNDEVRIYGYASAQSVTQVGSNVVVVLSDTDQLTFGISDLNTVEATLRFYPATYGTSGDDTITGTSGDDVIAGGAGADTLNGVEGNDTLYSGDLTPAWNYPYYYIPYTAPELDRGTEVDTLNGGAGDDTIFAGYGDNVDGGDGTDTLFISFQEATSGVTFATGVGDQTIGGGAIANIEAVGWVEGSNLGDTINLQAGGGFQESVIFGMDGDDVLTAGTHTVLIDGGDGNDTIDGTWSEYLQEIDGGAGDDTVYSGESPNTVINGGAGDDKLYTASETHGGDGNDIIELGFSYYGADSNKAYGDAGDDQILGSTSDDTLSGGTDTDTLTGNGGDDRFLFAAGDGHDTVTDFSTGDTIEVTGYGEVQSITQVGSDVVLALSSDDQITFQNTDVATVQAALTFVATDDTIVGTATDETFNGWGGNDIISGGGGADTINGGDGDDQLFAADPESSTYSGGTKGLDAGIDHDVLTGGAGDDLLSGGFGDDIDGGDGTDTLRLNLAGAGAGVTLDTSDFATGPIAIGGGTIQNVEQVEYLRGTEFSDHLTIAGQANSVTVDAGGGDDFITSEGGPPLIFGGDGNDQIDVLAGSAFVFGEDGDDIIRVDGGSAYAGGGNGDDFFYSGAGSDEFFGDAGNDTVSYLLSSGGQFVDLADSSNTQGDLLDSIENINGSNFADTLIGDYQSNGLSGGNGDDTISGGYGNDTLTGSAGNDTFVFAVGCGQDLVTDFTVGDTLKIADYLSAQSINQVGSDVLIVLSPYDQITLQNTTVAIVQAALQFPDPPVNLVGTRGADTLVGGSADDSLNGAGGNDILDGKGGADTMTGGTGNDTFYVDNESDQVIELARGGTDTVHAIISYGLAANVENGILDGAAAIDLIGNNLVNTLTGNSGDNFLYGMGGNDKLIGGAGNDTLRGGLGTDTLTGGLGADLFQFEKGGGNDKVTDFVSGTDKIDLHLISGITSADVHWAVSRGNMIVSVDANHDGRADFTITLTGASSINSGDFIFG